MAFRLPVHNGSSRLVAGLFGLVIALPLLAHLIPALEFGPEVKAHQNPAVLPAYSETGMEAYPAAFEAYFNDTFAYREPLIRLNLLSRYELFNVAGTDKVLAGRDGWLFFKGGSKEAGMPVENHHGDWDAFPSRSLERIQRRLEQTRNMFAAHGVDYIFVVAPDKWSIYPEHLPASYQSDGGPTCVEQLVQHLLKNTTLNVLDLRQGLLEAKGHWPVFTRGDTHWSELGAFKGADYLLRTIATRYPEVRGLDAQAYELTYGPAAKRDLVEMIGLESHLAEDVPNLSPDYLPSLTVEEDAGPERHPIVVWQDRPELPRAIMLRDSYGDAMIPFVAAGFQHVEFLWTANVRRTGLEEVLVRARPRVAIEMRAERFALHLAKYYQVRETDLPESARRK